MPCQCLQLGEALARAGVPPAHPSDVRCAVCIDAILESKNEVIREMNALREQNHQLIQQRAQEHEEFKRLQGIVEGLAGRVVAQSEILSRAAERPNKE